MFSIYKVLAELLGIKDRIVETQDRADLTEAERGLIEAKEAKGAVVKGATLGMKDGKRVIYYNGQTIDASTSPHEYLHAYVKNAAPEMKTELSKVMGLPDSSEAAWNAERFTSGRTGKKINAHERLAEYWESYLTNENAKIPSGVRALFDRLAAAMRQIFKAMGWKREDVPKGLNKIFDDMAAGKARIEGQQTSEEGHSEAQAANAGIDTAEADTTAQADTAEDIVPITRSEYAVDRYGSGWEWFRVDYAKAEAGGYDEKWLGNRTMEEAEKTYKRLYEAQKAKDATAETARAEADAAVKKYADYEKWIQADATARVKAGDDYFQKLDDADYRALKEKYRSQYEKAKARLLDAEEGLFQIVGERGAAALDKAEEATHRLDNLNVARDMEKAGKDAKAVRLATGWERGVDGKWRYEIEDIPLNIDALAQLSENRLNYNFRKKKAQPEYHAPLSEMVTDKALVKTLETTYGKMPHITFTMEAGFTAGLFNPDSNSIDISTWVKGAGIKSVLLHEIQHWIQAHEGFSRGDDMSKGFGVYQNSAGEVEARNVQRRMNFTSQQRLETMLKDTEDVSRKDITVLEEAANRPMLAVNSDLVNEIQSGTTAPKEVVDRWKADLENVLDKSNVPETKIIDIGDMPYIYSLVGINDKQLKTNKQALLKAMGQAKDAPHKHYVTRQTLDNLIEKIYNPDAILKSHSKSQNPNGYVVVTDEIDSNGDIVVVIISPSKSGSDYSFIPTIYGRGNWNSLIEHTANEGKILYVKNKKSRIWGQLSLLPRHIQDLNKNIIVKDEIVNNTPPDESSANQAELDAAVEDGLFQLIEADADAAVEKYKDADAWMVADMEAAAGDDFPVDDSWYDKWFDDREAYHQMFSDAKERKATRKAAPVTTSSADDRFIQKMKSNENLSEFADSIGRAIYLFEKMPSREAEEDALLAKQLPGLFTIGRDKREHIKPTERQLKSMRTLINESPTQYRRVYTKLTGDPEFVEYSRKEVNDKPYVERAAAEAETKVLSIKQQSRLALKFEADDIRQAVRTGEITDDRLEKVIADDKLDIAELKNQIETTEQTYKTKLKKVNQDLREERDWGKNLSKAYVTLKKELTARVHAKVGEIRAARRLLDEKKRLLKSIMKPAKLTIWHTEREQIREIQSLLYKGGTGKRMGIPALKSHVCGKLHGGVLAHDCE